MTGKVTVRLVEDWLTPYEVTVAVDGREPVSTRHMAPARAQLHALAAADEHGLELAYYVERPDVPPIVVTPAMFAARYQRVCEKCRESKPINAFRPLERRNHGGRNDISHYGWSERCFGCEEAESCKTAS